MSWTLRLSAWACMVACGLSPCWYSARAALNFHLTLLIASFACGVLAIIVVGFFLLIAVYTLAIIFGILAAVAANNGQLYRFPISIEFIK